MQIIKHKIKNKSNQTDKQKQYNTKSNQEKYTLTTHQKATARQIAIV